MVVRWACLLLPEVLVRIQFVTTTKPLIIEYLGTRKYGALAAALFFYMMHRMLPLLSVKIPKAYSRGTLSLIALFPSLRASRKKSISFVCKRKGAYSMKEERSGVMNKQE
jgi:hypothetical protein